MARNKVNKWKDDLPSTREWQDRTRAKIQTSMVLDRFHKCVSGEIELTNSAVNCGKALLDKTMPSLTSADVTGHPVEARTYDEVRAEMLSKYGPDLASLLLGEITPGQYATRVFKQSAAIQADTKPAEIQATEDTRPIQ